MSIMSLEILNAVNIGGKKKKKAWKWSCFPWSKQRSESYCSSVFMFVDFVWCFCKKKKKFIPTVLTQITGGAGFVGSHLTDKLMMDGHEVTVVDNFFTGRKRNVEHWIGHENFELINHDVVEPLYIEGE